MDGIRVDWIDTPGSSNVARFRREGGDLLVEFRGGAVYRYLNVPQPVHDALCAAPSKGAFIAASIRWQYPCLLVRKQAPELKPPAPALPIEVSVEAPVEAPPVRLY